MSDITTDTIFNLLGYGKEHAKTGEYLSNITGASGREVRECIEQLRHEYIIINDQDGAGYYLSNDPQEARRYYRQEYNRAISILRRLKPVRQFLKAHGVKAQEVIPHG